MSTSEELFDEYTKGIGGAYGMENEHFRRIKIEFYERINLFKNNYDHDNIPEVYLGFINDSQFKAVSFKYKEKYFVGLSIGTINSLFNFFDYLLSQQFFMPEYGGIKVEKTAVLQFDKKKKKLIDNFYYFDEEIDKHVRLYEAHQIFYKAINYLLMHELSHILNGHLDLNIELDDSFMMFEDDSIESKNMDIRKSLEYDADSAATSYCITPSELWGVSEDNLKITVRELVIAMYFLYKLTALNEMDLESYSNRTYPFPAQRIAIQMGTIVTLLIDIEKTTKISEEKMSEYANNIYFECIKASANMFGNDPIDDTSLYFLSKNSKVYSTRISRAWNSIRDELEKYAFIRIAPKDEEFTFENSFDYDEIFSKKNSVT